ncbi:ABC transporter ATP-binding protein [Kiritimatiella glycovorans]|uniref:ATP-binding cassette domain-containing protein n=1 Tax=Kiritimatiella glycovorans TaxID=1307763 RepID=UPI001364B190|nr:ABC transporter ATP-binding protein [Kiritimatiella glycovorans]
MRLCFAHSLQVKGARTIEFSGGMNVVAGPNGSGKSTLLRALNTCERCEIRRAGGAPVRYFSAETMNPHHPTGPAGDMQEMILRVRGVFTSHGEIMRSALAAVPLREGETLLVDEPEAGQDLEGVKRIREAFDVLCARGGQVIAATHHPVLMEGVKVIELVPGYVGRMRAECRRWLGEDADRSS